VTVPRSPQILVAGIGNAWLRDDGFGSEVVRMLRERGKPPAGLHLADFGTSGLDLAYEVMRGYDGLILVDASRQGRAPGTLYVMEPAPEDVDGSIEDGQVLDPHSMDPLTVLRFVKYVGGWPGRVVVVACEPLEVADVGFGLSEPVAAALEKAADVVLQTAAELQAGFSPAAPRPAGTAAASATGAHPTGASATGASPPGPSATGASPPGGRASHA
jgi:hydrogenase maturation protease